MPRLPDSQLEEIRAFIATEAKANRLTYGAYAALMTLIDEVDALRLERVAPSCGCAAIMRADPSRHFKECPLRATYPVAMSGPEAYVRGWEECIAAAAREIRVFQDIVGWQPGESRNRLIGDIEDRVRKLRPPEAK